MPKRPIGDRDKMRIGSPSLTNGLKCSTCGMFERKRGRILVGKGEDRRTEVVYGCANTACPQFRPATCEVCNSPLREDGTCPKDSGYEAVARWENFTLKEPEDD